MQTVTAAILMQGGKVLIGQRKAGKQMAHLWEFPGGKLEHGETPEACLAREIKEELALDVAVRELFGESVYHYEHGPVRLLVYRVEEITGELTPLDHQECRWVAISDLGNYEFVPADIPIVQKLQECGDVH